MLYGAAWLFCFLFWLPGVALSDFERALVLLRLLVGVGVGLLLVFF